MLKGSELSSCHKTQGSFKAHRYVKEAGPRRVQGSALNPVLLWKGNTSDLVQRSVVAGWGGREGWEEHRGF